MDVSQKIKAVRQAEKVTQQQLSDLAGISLSTLKKNRGRISGTQCHNAFKNY